MNRIAITDGPNCIAVSKVLLALYGTDRTVDYLKANTCPGFSGIVGWLLKNDPAADVRAIVPLLANSCVGGKIDRERYEMFYDEIARGIVAPFCARRGYKWIAELANSDFFRQVIPHTPDAAVNCVCAAMNDGELLVAVDIVIDSCGPEDQRDIWATIPAMIIDCLLLGRNTTLDAIIRDYDVNAIYDRLGIEPIQSFHFVS